jgi:hypothetical protein
MLPPVVPLVALALAGAIVGGSGRDALAGSERGPATAAGLSPPAAGGRRALDPPPRPGPFGIDLYRGGDFVSQATHHWCVAASMLTMMNIVDEGADHSTARQRRLYDLARTRSTWRLVGPGAEPEGWARGLDALGYGPYAVHVDDTRSGAIRTAARALRMTGRPVGLLLWHGAHAWVMSGFEATADPAYTDDFAVTALSVEDAWYPRISSVWGASRPPDTLVPLEALSEAYLPWRRPSVRYPEKDGLFVLVLPIAEAPARLR